MERPPAICAPVKVNARDYIVASKHDAEKKYDDALQDLAGNVCETTSSNVQNILLKLKADSF